MVEKWRKAITLRGSGKLNIMAWCHLTMQPMRGILTMRLCRTIGMWIIQVVMLQKVENHKLCH